MDMKERFAEAGLTQMEVAEQIGVTRPVMSMICNGQVLPNKDTAEKICDAVKLPILALYSAEDIHLAECGKKYAKNAVIIAQDGKPPHRIEERTAKKFTARLTPWAEEVLTEDIVHACGFRSLTDWLHACIRDLNITYQYVVRGGDNA